MVRELAAIGLTEFVLLVPAYADTLVYSNGQSAISLRYYSLAETLADDFTLTTPASINVLRYWTWEYAGFPPGAFMNWAIWPDSGIDPPASRPATVSIADSIASGSAVATATATGRIDGFYQQYENTLELADIHLSAGTYWISLNAPASAPGSGCVQRNP